MDDSNDDDEPGRVDSVPARLIMAAAAPLGTDAVRQCVPDVP